jgi:hypothetical protein
MDKAESTGDDVFSDEETERRARGAIRRSFDMPRKLQKEMVGNTGRPAGRKRTPSKIPKKAE